MPVPFRIAQKLLQDWLGEDAGERTATDALASRLVDAVVGDLQARGLVRMERLAGYDLRQEKTD